MPTSFINTVIVENGQFQRKTIKQFTKQEPRIKLLADLDTTEQVTLFIDQKEVNLILINIQNEGHNDMDFISSYKGSARFIIISKKKEYAAQAFDQNVIDYITTPFTPERFSRAIAKYEQLEITKKPKREQRSFIIKSTRGIVRLRYTDIVYIKAMSDYIQIHTTDKKHLIYTSLSSMEEQLPSNDFFRTHRSYIISIEKMKEIIGGKVIVNETSIPLSRYRKENLITLLFNLELI